MASIEGLCVESVVAYFSVLSRNLPESARTCNVTREPVILLPESCLRSVPYSYVYLFILPLFVSLFIRLFSYATIYVSYFYRFISSLLSFLLSSLLSLSFPFITRVGLPVQYIKRIS